MPRLRTTPNADTGEGTTQTARATLALRELLVQGHFHAGERLREIPLAQQLGVSRIPLRLAMERLSHEGFLEKYGSRGFAAQQFSIGDIRDAIDLRGSIEGTAARLAAERIEGPHEVALLHALNNDMTRLVRRCRLSIENVARYIDLNSKFHTEILRLSRSRLLRRAMEQVCAHPFASPNAFIRRQYVAPESRELFLISVEHHRAIIEAIENREGARADSITREHARVARRNLESALNNLSRGESVPGLKLIKF